MNHLNSGKASHFQRQLLVLRLAALLALMGSTFSASVFSLEDDRSQPIRVKADSAERDDKRGVTTYRGDVIIDQGSLTIAAQEVVIYGSQAVTRIVAKGNPARLQQQPSPDKGVIIAKGNNIEYSLETEIVQLEDNAYVEQDGTKVRGGQISYDMKQQIVRANGNTNSEQRVEMIIPASNPATSSTKTPGQKEER
ncbi:MAG: lipopolysaccharide transport periplasmic protein LptA [Pseudomonadales bacterium]